jgi:hypothetical protein
MEMGMDENQTIPKDLLDGLRSLNDDGLTKVLGHIHEYGWQKSVEVLRMLLEERRETG